MTNKTTNAMFLDEFIPWCANCVITDKNIIMTGDFNMHVNDMNDPEAVLFTESMEALGITQHVHFPTHRLGNSLDLVFTKSTNIINVSNIAPGQFISDHCLVLWITSIPRSDLISKTITTRKIKEINIEEFSDDINMDNITTMDNLDEIIN